MADSLPSLIDRAALLERGMSDQTVLSTVIQAGQVVADSHMQGLWLTSIERTRHLKQHDLIAALSARTALKSGMVGALVAWAIRHGTLPPTHTFNAECVLQEALVNAIIHGNCGLPGLSSFGHDQLTYSDTVARHMDDPVYGTRPVVISFRRLSGLTIVHVDDVGNGYQRDIKASHDPLSTSGRGFAIMRHFASNLRLSRGGRRMSAGFAHA